ncbi:hypothetical protein KI387_035685, partial [Taxus chinensis]
MEIRSFSFGVLSTLLLVMCCLLPIMAMPPFLMQKQGHHTFMRKTDRSAISNMDSYKTYNYTQVLDHFSYTPQSYQTFPQRYVMDKSNWGGAQNNSPIFVYLGAESDIEGALGVGIMTDQAPKFKALLVFIEHRYYGTSMPFGGEEEAYANATTLRYFTSTQALADYATVIIALKKDLDAQNCPVIVFGESYGGMLAAWFRLKYPHVAFGALAASAPILYFDDITPTYCYGRVVTENFRNASENCYKRINESWDMMDKIASSPQGLIKLSILFNTCQNLSSKDALYSWIALQYIRAAQYNFTKVEGICNAINSLPEEENTVGRIVAAAEYINGGRPCLDLHEFYSSNSGWAWQTCTEMVIPIGYPAGKTMFPPSPFDIKAYARNCYLNYGVLPRPHWATTEFGGHNIKAVLRDFGSNIIFSNGLRDPYSCGGVLENISGSLVAISTELGTHCQDTRPPTQNDPEWLKEQRIKEIGIIQKWID